MQLSYITHLANYSDGILYILAFLLLLELAVMIDRFWYLRRTLMGGGKVLDELTTRSRLDRQTLVTLADQAKGLPEESLLRMAANHAGRVKGEALANRLEETISVLAPQLDRRLWLLDTIITLAPLLGLLGTIIGMFHAFHALSGHHMAPTQVTGGIADALIATASGLFIAIVGLLNFNGFNNQVRQIMQQLDSVKMMLLNRMDGQPMLHPDAPEDDLSAQDRVAMAAGAR